MDVYWENDSALFLPLLDRDWEFQLGGAPPGRVQLPAAWETHTTDKLTDGPAYYRRAFELDRAWLDRRIVLEAHAISYYAVVRVNGRPAGEHTGLWSAFQLDITSLVHVGVNALEIEVWKPGGRFPLRETLAGFLPDVCTAFGGVWQDVRLLGLAGAAFHDVMIHTQASGRVHVRGRIVLWEPAGPLELDLALEDSAQASLAHATLLIDPADLSFSTTLDVPGVAVWPPGKNLYDLQLMVRAGGRTLARLRRSIGFRDVAVSEGGTRLNDQPLHVRGVLDWGWDAQHIAPLCAQATEHFALARALGFNLWKCCLFVPPEAFFDAADRAGMWVWLEMPMWLPRVTAEFKARALREYEAIFRRLHHHPSLVIVSLGCELNAQADADFLRALHALARAWLPNVLLCDNSGSAEAYGGVDLPLSDFYDYHFYTDPHFFEPLIQHFTRAYRARRPWIYGEFCDADTLRDFRSLQPEPWWLTERVALERDDYLHQRAYRARLAAAGVDDGGAALTQIARRQATAVRKYILELVRRYNATGGYVVTGWMDTPIATSGVVDDHHRVKFSPDEWRCFNADVVLTIDRERRRRWVGGDRPSPRDPFTWWQGDQAEIHVIVSNGSGAIERGELRWQVNDASGAVIASGAHALEALPGGALSEIATLPVIMPTKTRPVELTLTAQIDLPTGTLTRNAWTLWAIPRPRLPARLALEAPLLHRHRLAQLDRSAQFLDAAEQPAPALPIIAAELSESLIARVREGARGVLWLTQADARFTLDVPFWREAIHVFAPHPLWERVPHAGHADMRFFSVATDFALDAAKLTSILGVEEGAVTAIWRRFDARQMLWAHYIIEASIGRGRLLITTLHLEGGLGHQPVTFETNPLGAWLLASLLEVSARPLAPSA